MDTLNLSMLGKEVITNIIKEARTTIEYGKGLKIDKATDDIIEACEEADAWLEKLIRELAEGQRPKIRHGEMARRRRMR